jgi:hypothetical protein
MSKNFLQFNDKNSSTSPQLTSLATGTTDNCQLTHSPSSHSFSTMFHHHQSKPKLLQSLSQNSSTNYDDYNNNNDQTSSSTAQQRKKNNYKVSNWSKLKSRYVFFFFLYKIKSALKSS